MAGQPEFERRLDQPNLRQLKQRINLRCRLTPLTSDEVGPYIDHRLKKAGYQGKTLFEAKALERISLNSQGIPRLINVICDNALLLAYASSKKKVSAEMIEEVARDLELSVPVEDFQRPRGRDEVTRAEMRGDETRAEPVSEKFFIKGPPGELYPNRKAKKVGSKVFLGVLIMTSIGAVIYSQQNRDLASDIAVRIEDYSRQSGNYLSSMAVKVEQRGRKSFSDAAMKAGDYAELSSNYFSDLTVRMKTQFPQGTKFLFDLAATMDTQFQKTSDSVSETALKMRDYLVQMPAKMRGSLQQGWDYLSGLPVKLMSLIPTEKDSLKDAYLIPETPQDNRPNIALADPLDRRPHDRPAPASEEPAAITDLQTTLPCELT